MTNPLFTPEDVTVARLLREECGNCFGCCDPVPTCYHTTETLAWLQGLAGRIQQWIDQQKVTQTMIVTNDSGEVLSMTSGVVTFLSKEGSRPVFKVDPIPPAHAIQSIHETDLEEG